MKGPFIPKPVSQKIKKKESNWHYFLIKYFFFFSSGNFRDFLADSDSGRHNLIPKLFLTFIFSLFFLVAQIHLSNIPFEPKLDLLCFLFIIGIYVWLFTSQIYIQDEQALNVMKCQITNNNAITTNNLFLFQRKRA